MSDLEDPANESLTSAELAKPSGLDGQASGVPHAAHLPKANELNSLDLPSGTQWCTSCLADVVPVGKGRCPRCKKFLRLNYMSRRHPINVLRVDALKAKLLTQFPPANVIEESMCEQMASVLERLEILKPGSPEWGRLTAVAHDLGVSLQEAHLARPTPPSLTSGATEDEILARAERLIKHVHEQRAYRAQAEAQAKLRAETETKQTANDITESGNSGEAKANDNSESTISASYCDFCRRDPCFGPSDHRYAALHHFDPIEVKKRDALATAEMYASLSLGRNR